MDTTVTLSAAQAMQVQAALGERLTKLWSTPRVAGSFETECVIAALADATEAMQRLMDALYPVETDEFAGDHHIYPVGVGR